MGIFSYILLGFILFVFLRQLPSHKLYVLTQDLQEAQSYFSARVEEGLISGSYLDDFRARLNELQAETDALQRLMKSVWPFSYRDFWYMFRGVTKKCYKLRDDVESVRNNIWRHSSQEKIRLDMYKTVSPSLRARCPSDYFTDASSPASPTLSPVSSPSPPRTSCATTFPTPYISPNRRFDASMKMPRAM
ncbi:hypothetical protein C8Q73DRAFT_794117 [Cubamyces lactineus]|nr:hypothetical protein C8Q73DRAFT_794117 [Cubamyces lactineus]